MGQPTWKSTSASFVAPWLLKLGVAARSLGAWLEFQISTWFRPGISGRKTTELLVVL